MKKNLPFVLLMTMCSLTSGQTLSRPREVHSFKKSAIHVPAQLAPTGMKVIYSNLAKPTDAYDANDGWSLSGPNDIEASFVQFDAMPFTPKSNAHVSEVQVAVQYGGSGANQVNLSLYAGGGGVPGTLLAGPVTVTNLPHFGTCCNLAVANFPPVAVTAGTQYWVVADTPLSGVGSDFDGVWTWVVDVQMEWAQEWNGTGWFATGGDGLPAGEVLGTIP